MQRRLLKLGSGLLLAVVTAAVSTRAGTLEGTVRDVVTNAVLSGIWVSVQQGQDPNYAGEDAWDWVDGAQTDANGHFSFAGLAARHYVVRADAGVAGNGGRYLGDQHLDIAVGAAGTTTVPDLLLRQAGYLYGYVRDAGSGQPVPGAEVLVEMSFTEEGNTWHWGTTDGTGRYELALAPTATAVYPVQILQAAKPGTDQWYAVQLDPTLYPASVAGTPGPDFDLSLGGVIRGRVTTPDGTPVPSTYTLSPLARIAGGTFEDPGANTDADGVYHIRGVPPDVDVWLMTSGWNSVEVDGTTYTWGERFVGPYRVVAGQTLDVPSLYMPEVGSVLVTVRNPGNNPLPGAYVELTGYDQFGGGVWLDEGDMLTDAQGRVLFDAVPPGRYVIRTTSDGYALDESPEFAVASGNQAQPVVVMAAAGGPCTIAGSITNFANLAPKNQGGDVLPLTDEYEKYDLPAEMGAFSYATGTTWNDEQLLWPDRQFTGEGDAADGYADHLQPGGPTAGTYMIEDITSGNLAVCGYSDRPTGISGAWMVLLSDPVVRTPAAGQTLTGVDISIPIGTGKVQGTVSFPGGYTPDLTETAHQIYLRLQGSTAPLGRAVGNAAPSLQYALAELPAGTYQLYAVARGMQAYTTAFFALAAGQTITRNIIFTAAAANQSPVIDVPATDQVKPEAWEGDAYLHEVTAHDPDTFNSLRYSWWERADGQAWTQVFERPGDPLTRPVKAGPIPFHVVGHPATSLANAESKVIAKDNFGAQTERLFRATTLHDVNRAPVRCHA
ncbi:carboxypeptidase regulatory-like domain-containing protein [bacterium]|nr:carboxypeptidase regulatory-like domain-containing protein [bacterium]